MPGGGPWSSASIETSGTQSFGYSHAAVRASVHRFTE